MTFLILMKGECPNRRGSAQTKGVGGVQESIQGERAQMQITEDTMFNPQSFRIESDVNNIDESSLVNVPSD